MLQLFASHACAAFLSFSRFVQNFDEETNDHQCCHKARALETVPFALVF